MDNPELDPGQETDSYLQRALTAWAGLWIVYNGVLLGEGLNVGSLGYVFRRQFSLFWSGVSGTDIGFVIVFGIVANAFYCLGPLGECYYCILLGRRLGWRRYVLFALGLAFSMFLVFFMWVAYFTLL